MPCPSYGRAIGLVEAGCASRAVGATHLNERSSRSHTIVRVQLEARGPPPPRTGGGKPVQGELRSTALIHFVDLAGSERLAKTGSSGLRCA